MCASIWYYSRLLLGIVIVSQGEYVFAQSQTIPGYSFRRISMQDGLANQIISAAGEDQRGMLWLGTHNGLYRFDGFRVTHFSDHPKGFLSTEFITDLECLQTSSSHLLIVCTQGKSWLLDTEHERLLPFSSFGLPDSILSKSSQIEKYQDGKYIALCGRALYQIEQAGPNRFSIHHFSTFPDSVSGTIVVDPAEPDVVWLLPHIQEVFRITKSEISRYTLPPYRQTPSPVPGLLGLVRTPYGLIGWDYVRNLCRLEPVSNTFKSVSDFSLEDVFPTISVLDHALNQRNVLRFHRVLQNGQELAGTTLGLFILQNRSNHFQVPEGMAGSEIRGILTDSSGSWLAGTYTGLFSGALSHNAIKPLSKIAGVWGGIPLDTSNWMLVCENPVGIFVLNRKNSTVRRPQTLSPRKMKGSALSICRDYLGNIWVGTYTNLYWSHPNDPFNFNVLNLPESQMPVQAPFFRALLSEPDSSVWAGAENGLFRLELQNFPNHWSIDTLLQNVFISDLYPDRHNNVWIATKGQGIARYNRATGSFDWFDTNHGLASNSTCRIEGSNADTVLWISTHNGLSRLDVRSKVIHNYHEEDGIPGNEFNSAASADFPDGTLIFGGVSGLVLFHPDSLRPRSFRYKTFFSHLHLQANSGDSLQLCPLPEGSLFLPPYPRLVEICLGMNDFVQSAKPQFRYRLTGAFESWVYTNGENKIRFFNLSPGNYVLEVQALPYDGHLGPPVQMTMHVAQPVSETWWFRALMLAGLVLVSFLAYRYRLRQALRTYIIRQQIADDLHDDIGNKLNMTNILLQKVRRDFLDKDQPPPPGIWADVLETNQQTLQSLRTLIWSVDPRKDRLENVFARMQDFADDFLLPLNIQYQFSLPEQVPDKETLLDFRHNIVMIFQELLTNMVKHALPRQVSVNLSLPAENTLTLSISNTFENRVAERLQTTSDKRGMTTLQRRLEKINGAIQLFETTDTNQTIILSFSRMFK